MPVRLELPGNPRSWEKKVSRHDGDVSRIHTLETIKSASKIYEGQFLSLRVLWKSSQGTVIDTRKLGIEPEYNEASEFLNKLGSWRKYLEDIREMATKATGFPDLGTFTLVRDHQLEVGQIQEEQADTPAAGFTPIADKTRNKTKHADPQDSPLLGKGKPLPEMRDLVEKYDLDGSQEESPEDTESEESSESDESDESEESKESPESDEPEESDESSESDEHSESDKSSKSAEDTSPISKEAAGILYPPTRDEQIVNTALLLFLRAISIHKLRTPNWTLHRRIFQASFASGELEARTDGYLESISNGASKAKVIVEVKPFIREENKQIRMQESAQMVAWIKNEPDTASKPKPRLLIAQDRQEIYVVIGTYDNDYVSYLEGDKKKQGKTAKKAQAAQAAPKKSFLRMEEYGPFNVENHSQMDKLGKLMLAVTMAAQ